MQSVYRVLINVFLSCHVSFVSLNSLFHLLLMNTTNRRKEGSYVFPFLYIYFLDVCVHRHLSKWNSSMRAYIHTHAYEHLFFIVSVIISLLLGGGSSPRTCFSPLFFLRRLVPICFGGHLGGHNELFLLSRCNRREKTCYIMYLYMLYHSKRNTDSHIHGVRYWIDINSVGELMCYRVSQVSFFELCGIGVKQMDEFSAPPMLSIKAAEGKVKRESVSKEVFRVTSRLIFRRRINKRTPLGFFCDWQKSLFFSSSVSEEEGKKLAKYATFFIFLSFLFPSFLCVASKFMQNSNSFFAFCGFFFQFPSLGKRISSISILAHIVRMFMFVPFSLSALLTHSYCTVMNKASRCPLQDLLLL